MIVLLVAELSGAATAVVDGLITSRYLGNAAMAACGIAAPYFSVMSILSGIIMIGCQGICVYELGKGNSEKANAVFNLSFFLGLFSALLVAVTGEVFAEGVSVLFGAKGDGAYLMADSAAYLRGIFIGAPFWVLFMILSPILQLDGRGNLVKIGSLVLAFVDVAGDLLNVFVFKGGLFGMGLATGLSHIAGCLVLLVYFLKKGHAFRLSFKKLPWKETGPLLKEGVPRALTMVARALDPIVLNALILKISSDVGIVALSVQRSISFLFASVGWGIAGAVLMLCSMYYTEQNDTELDTSIKCALKSILIYVGILAALLFALAPLISGLFVPEAGAVRQEGTAVIRYYAVSLVFLAFNVRAANLFQSISKVTAANIINIAVEFVSMCAFAALLGFTFGLKGFWIAFPVSQAVISAVIIICFLIRRKSFGFDRQVGHALQASAGSLEEIVEFSQKLSLECRERGLDRRTSYLLPLCVVEMTKIIVQYVLKDGKEHHLETRVLFGDDIVLSIRDDCEKLDMVEMIKNWSYDTEHPENNVGIMMVRKTAKDIKYSNTMRLNNLQIIL